MSTDEEYFQKYRRLIARSEELKRQQDELETQFRDSREIISNRMRQCHDELSAMRRVITAMLDNGWDPVEAQLKLDESMHQRLMGETMWDRTRHERMHIDSNGTINLGQITSLTAMGPTGAVGANGAAGPYVPAKMTTSTGMGFVDGHGDYHGTDSGNGYEYEAYRTYDTM